MSPQPDQARTRQRLLADSEGDEAPAVPHDVVLSARLQRPSRRFRKLREAAVLQPPAHLGDGVERRGRGIDECAEVASE